MSWNFQGPVYKCGSWTSAGIVKTDSTSCGSLWPRWLVCIWVDGNLGKWMCRQPAQAQRGKLFTHVSQLLILRTCAITLWFNLLPTFPHLPTMNIYEWFKCMFCAFLLVCAILICFVFLLLQNASNNGQGLKIAMHNISMGQTQHRLLLDSLTIAHWSFAITFIL